MFRPSFGALRICPRRQGDGMVATDQGTMRGAAAGAALSERDGLPMPRRRLAWATIILGLTLAVLDGTIANVALPTIAQEFSAPAATSIWIVNGYQLAIVMALLPLSALGEIFGYRRVYLLGIALFTVASLGCVLAGGLTTLTIARIVQGLGGAGLMSVNAAVLRYTVPKAKFGAAIGINALVVAAASTAGPAIAGFALAVVSWRWLFAINLPLGVLVVALGWRSLPDSDRAHERFDWIDAVLSATGFGLVVTIIDSFGHDISWAVVLPQVAACVTALVLLVARSRRVARPMLPLDLLRLPVFSLSIGTSVASFAAQMLAFVSLPFTFQLVYGFPPVEVGLLMTPWPLAVAVVAPIAGRLADTRSPAVLGGVGLILLAAGLVLMGVLPAHPAPWNIAWRMALCGLGFGLFQAPNNRTMIGAAPKARSGAASGMRRVARLMGQSIGAALVALLLAQLGMAGATTAQFVGAGFATVAAVVSMTRLAY